MTAGDQRDEKTSPWNSSCWLGHVIPVGNANLVAICNQVRNGDYISEDETFMLWMMANCHSDLCVVLWRGLGWLMSR